MKGSIEWVDRTLLTRPPERGGMYHVYVDHWWPIDATGRIAFYHPIRDRDAARYNYPQANTSEQIARKLQPEGAVDAVLLPHVFTPHDCRDYL